MSCLPYKHLYKIQTAQTQVRIFFCDFGSGSGCFRFFEHSSLEATVKDLLQRETNAEVLFALQTSTQDLGGTDTSKDQEGFGVQNHENPKCWDGFWTFGFFGFLAHANLKATVKDLLLRKTPNADILFALQTSMQDLDSTGTGSIYLSTVA